MTSNEPPSPDDTEKTRAEGTRLRGLLESPLIAVGFADASGRLTDANDAFLRLFVYDRSDLARVRWDDLVPPEYRIAQQAAVEQADAHGAATPFEAEYQAKDGRRLPVHVSITRGGEPGTTSVIVLDISYRRRVEEQLLKAQRMEAVGRLAGGIAHDFNNLLCAITGYADLMRTQMRSEDHLRPHVNQVLEAADRAARLVRQLLAFSRKDALKPSFVDLSTVVRDLAPLLRRVIGEDIELTTHLEPGLERVWADAGQLEQVVMNLAVNARDAMPRGGRLTIVTQNAGSVERRREPRPRHSRPPQMVRLTVADTGSGMDEETLTKIWEPFFTTKDPEKGTGLGLVTVHGIVSHAGGSIQVMSRVGEGTTFHVLFPSASGQEIEAIERSQPQAAPPPRGSMETILVVEDEDLLRDVLAAVLQEHGYSVLAAGNSQEALSALERHPGAVQVALVDVVLPGGSGPELCRELVRRRPDLKPIYMSGRVGEEALREANAVAGPLIAKPFRPEELLEIIGGLLAYQPHARPS